MTILMFGVARDIIGGPSLSLPISQEGTQYPNTIGELRLLLQKHYPALEKLSSLAIAVNNSYAKDDVEINSNDEIAVIPPVSGG